MLRIDIQKCFPQMIKIIGLLEDILQHHILQEISDGILSLYGAKALPHSEPDGFSFQRKNGDYTLTMMADPQFGLPYGSLPRLLLAWLIREAKRTQSPEIHLGKTFSTFLRTLKLSQSGGERRDAIRLRDQMLRLFTTHISCIDQNKKEGV